MTVPTASAPAPRAERWRPSQWRRPPEQPSLDRVSLALVLAVLVAYNVLGNLWLPDDWYVPVNVAVSAGLVALVRWRGFTLGEVGLARDLLGRGLAVGAIVFAVVASVVAVSALLPGADEAYTDDRASGLSGGGLLYQMLVHVPFGTALLEEVAFRGVLFAILLRRWSPLGAATGSSVVFGLWHVLPATSATAGNELVEQVAGGGAARVATIVGGVLVTWLVGYWFCWLRLRADSLLAPILAHTASNSTAYLVAWLTSRSG